MKNIWKKYFWSENETALRQIEQVLRHPADSQFMPTFYRLLSRSDNAAEVFSVVSRADFVKTWPAVRKYWSKMNQARDFLAWWETVYEQLLAKQPGKTSSGAPLEFMRSVGLIIRKVRLDKGWSQSDLALRTGLKQPDVSAVEKGRQNITLFTLARLCRVLEIKKITLKM